MEVLETKRQLGAWDIPAERVYYHAFEACLNGSYPAKDFAERDVHRGTFRQRLLPLMLQNRGWSTKDVDFNLNAPEPPYLLDGKPAAPHYADPLHYLRGTDVPTYKSVEGIRIEERSGKVDLVLQEDRDGLISYFDIIELLHFTPEGALFRYAPFQATLYGKGHEKVFAIGLSQVSFDRASRLM